MTTRPVWTDPAAEVHWPPEHARKGFFTDTSICIGCKACEVACKEWNRNPTDGDFEILGSSYDNTGGLGANTWRHVAFIEQDRERIEQARESGRRLVSLGMPQVGPPEARTGPGAAPGADAGPGAAAASAPVDVLGGLADGTVSTADPTGPGAGMGVPGTGVPGAAGVDTAPPDTPEFRWLMSSDVCKHCTHAGCLDVCPTGALFRTEFGTVVVQADICNGCGTCVAGCPFGVIERRDDGTVSPKTDRDGRARREQDVPHAGTANKCTLCYDRLVDGLTPACAKTCPTTSIKFGDHSDMVDSAEDRVRNLHAQGMTEARLYGANPADGVGGTGSVFLLLDEPEVYGLPPDPRVPTKDLPQMFATAGIAAAGMIAATALAFLSGRS
ncbi:MULTISPECIES: 4Fe-4S dicluster domain-containing protein [Brevibacterium]|uniref:4Fe-4S dicluster domain-containing protein n=1 Tax=Brevibacterium pityocampae TaxID=506594 RepID=A0ABP8IZX6_9MICO|nr:4Fe-4S dicluster domain-containing protein [Brevibacterium sp. CS2]QCP06105.1 4Fe-4S dicluster domain-containing protein [Brevibacterium sp. CS2]